MSSPNYTNEQLAAINHDCEKQGSVIISAAAGSGKTAVLVEHIIQLITNAEKKVPADKIAVVTFTKKASFEIKARLEQALSKKLAETEQTEKNKELISKEINRYLHEQLIRLEDSKITTISAFCLDIIKQYAIEAGLRPGFRNLDEIEAEEFRKKAMDNTLEILYDEKHFNKEERSGILNLNGEIGDKQLSQTLDRFFDACSKLPDKDKWLSETERLYNDKNLFYKKLVPLINITFKKKTNMFKKLAEESCDIAKGTPKTEGKVNHDFRLACEWEKIQFCDLKNNSADIGKLLKQDCEKAYYGKTFSPEDKETLSSNQKLYKEIIKELKWLCKCCLAFDDTVEKQQPSVKTLIKLYMVYANEYRELKLAANAIDFNDNEHLCLELLNKNDKKLAAEIGNNLYEIIVDEFQDSNSVQYEIFSLLSKNGNNLYFVGDVKQSIYRFRNADPRVFTRVVEDKRYRTLYLNRNFRSNKDVINAVNGIFENLMTPELGGVLYDSSERLIQGLSEPKKCSGKETELCIINNKKADLEQAGLADINAKQLEARYIALRIRKMVDDGYKIITKDGKSRPCNYGDFAVIMSALSTVQKEFLDEFEKAGVPVIKGGKGDYLKLKEVQAAIDLLTIIDNPYKDLNLVSVLMSPLYDFSANDIANIRAFDNIENTGSKSLNFKNRKKNIKSIKTFYDSLSSYSNTESQTYMKVKSFLNDLMRFRAFSENHSPSRLIRNIFDEGVFLPLVSNSKNPEKIQVNLQILLYYADNLSGLSGSDIKSLSGFISFLSDKTESGKKLGEPDSTGGDNINAVNFTTIHASKGLEFPICFIARLNTKFNMTDTSFNVVFDDELGIGAYYIDPESLIRYDSLTHFLIKERAWNDTLSEEMRKLYVALTRARNKLILTAAADIEKRNDLKDNYLGFILKSGAIEKGVIEEVYPPLEMLKYSDDEENPLTGAEEPHIDLTLEKDRIKKALSAVYKRAGLTFIPKKLTATQIGVNSEVFDSSAILENNDEPSVFPRNPSFLKEKRLTGKKRGDCYHKAMQLIDFRKEDFAKQLDDMRYRFTAIEYSAVNREQILDFFKSELGQRAIKSDCVYKEYPLYTEIDFSELLGNEIGGAMDKEFCERPFVQGMADMFFYDNGEIVLVDYKTNRRPSAEKLIFEYKNQLRLYKKAIEEMTGIRVRECWLYSFEIGVIRVM